MKSLRGTASAALGRAARGLAPAEPLWKRVPTHDEQGKPLSDFMILIPRLSKRSLRRQQATLDSLQRVLEEYRHVVVFADLNLRLNLLWVSVRPQPGICLELPTAILACIPEARLVAQNPQHVVSGG